MIESTQNPMTPKEVADKLIATRFKTSRQSERDAMSNKMNRRTEIADKEAEMAIRKEYGIEGSMRSGL